MSEETQDLNDAIRDAHMRFMGEIAPVHSELHRYAWRLTGCAFAAEDLCQEAITRAFARVGQGGERVDNLKHYIFRTLTNVFRDECRRHTPEALDEPDEFTATEEPVTSSELGEAVERLATGLPPKERAAILLKDVFDFSLEETATQLEMTVGAVKSALHRARIRLQEPAKLPLHPPDAPPVDREVVDRFVQAFNAHDVEQLIAMVHPQAEIDLLGISRSADAGFRNLVITKTLEDPDLVEAQVADYHGSPVVLLLHQEQRIGEVVRLETATNKVTRARWYYFCPDTIRTVAQELGYAAKTHGFHGVAEH